MRHKRLKNFLKIGSLLFLICFVILACQKETFDASQEIAQQKKLKRITLNDFNAKMADTKDYETISAMFDINRPAMPFGFKSLDIANNPYLLTDEIVMIEEEHNTFFTFKIQSNTTGVEFYNLVVTVDANGAISSTKIIEYTPSDYWLQDKTQPFHGEAKIYENDIFSTHDISHLLASRNSGLCVTDVRGEWECNKGNNHSPMEVAQNPENYSCTSWDFIITLEWGPCPEIIDQGGSGSGGGNNFTVDPDNNANGGTTDGNSDSNNNNDGDPPGEGEDCVTDANGNCIKDTTTAMPLDEDIEEEEPLTPCDIIQSLENDDVFKQKMVILKNAAAQWTFEKLFTVLTDPTPNSQISQTDNYDYAEFQGNAYQPTASWSVQNSLTFLGLVHSHYNGLLSVHTVADLKDLYDVMKASEVTDGFFTGIVNNSGTAYVLIVEDRQTFLQFGDKWLSSKLKIDEFIKNEVLNNYNIREYNSDTVNEKGFVKMLSELGSGVSTFKSSDATFSNYKKLSIVNNQIIENDCN